MGSVFLLFGVIAMPNLFRTLTVLLVAFAALGVVPAAAQTPDDCYQATLKDDDAAVIRVCTRVLDKGGIQGATLSTTLSNRGLGYLRNREFDKAIVDFSEALLINPKNPYAFDNRGEAWREKGNLERALSDFNESLRVDATFTSAYLNRAITYELQGDKTRARADYQKALDQTGDRAIDKWARRQAQTRLSKLGGDDAPRRDPDRTPKTQKRQPDNSGGKGFRDGLGSGR